MYYWLYLTTRIVILTRSRLRLRKIFGMNLEVDECLLVASVCLGFLITMRFYIFFWVHPQNLSTMDPRAWGWKGSALAASQAAWIILDKIRRFQAPAPAIRESLHFARSRLPHQGSRGQKPEVHINSVPKGGELTTDIQYGHVSHKLIKKN